MVFRRAGLKKRRAVSYLGNHLGKENTATAPYPNLSWTRDLMARGIKTANGTGARGQEEPSPCVQAELTPAWWIRWLPRAKCDQRCG